MTRARRLRLAAAIAAGVGAILAPAAAGACGGFYAEQVEVAPDQEIVVVHRAGLETYVFRPRFCGVAADFGVILPIPATLASSPALAADTLYDELDRYTAPTVVEVCRSSGGVGCGADEDGINDAPNGDFGTGVDVVDRGKVGIFTWTLLQATSASAFTDWLTANGYPYDASGDAAYAHYVQAGWYFVAFQVSADASAPPAGMRLCGDLGPIQLSFAAPAPVIPARITSVNAAGAPAPTWRIAVVAATDQEVAYGGSFTDTLYFAGTLSQAQLGGFPALGALSQDGERLTVLDVRFPDGGATADIVLAESTWHADYRSQRKVGKDCGGCEAGGAPMGMAGAAAVLALARALRRRLKR